MKLLVTVEELDRSRSFTVRGSLTSRTAQWVAEAFQVDGHPLEGHVRRYRFRAHAINSQGVRWQITFSRQGAPRFLESRGRPVQVARADRASVTVWLEELEDLPITAGQPSKDPPCLTAPRPPRSQQPPGVTPRMRSSRGSTSPA